MINLFTLLLLLFLAVPIAAQQEPVRFQRDIKPILAKKCFACHGPDEAQRKANLRLDTQEGAHAARGNKAGAVVPGEALESELFRRISTKDTNDLMPPPEAGEPLTAQEQEKIAQWIQQGGVYEQHWAFVKPVRAEPPAVKNEAWPRNEIDHFILAQLEKEGIAPAPEADKTTLLRRVYLDLTGLLPSPEAVAAFLADTRPDAYERVVDQLLGSPHYGERWGRHWLDVARYADSNGYSIDGPRSIWKYRDWVINAINSDMPFDQFVVEQLAGDLLPDPSREQLIATGFHRNTMINQEGGIDKEEFRIQAVIDRVNTTSTAFLGLTMACAQCHTHKYDPITINEYYQMFAFFNGDEEEDLEVPTPEQAAAVAEARAAIDQAEAAVAKWWAENRLSLQPADLPEEARKALQPKEVAAIEKAPDARNEDMETTARQVYLKHLPAAKAVMDGLEAAKKQMPEVVRTMILRRRETPRETHILLAGDFTRPGELVAPGTPAALHPLAAEAPTRLDLAKWIVAPENPLTARVTVNRFWQAFFGKGIVETENDFGIQGSLPTHPQLLDWLAEEFMQGWRVKAMHRLMVTSATYRQWSNHRPELMQQDPLNRLLARQTRLRLEAESVRDVALAASGLLHPAIGGPSVFPPQPDGVMTLGQSNRAWETSTGADRYRRGMYTYFWRATPYHALMVFDAPDATVTCTRRTRSNTPLQALTLLNDQAFVELAQGLAKRVLQHVPPNDAQRVDYAFRVCLGRAPTASETATLQALLVQERQALAAAPQQAELIAATDFGHGVGRSEVAAWTTVARALMNTDEFITRE